MSGIDFASRLPSNVSRLTFRRGSQKIQCPCAARENLASTTHKSFAGQVFRCRIHHVRRLALQQFAAGPCASKASQTARQST
jgi:hypothetical protein